MSCSPKLTELLRLWVCLFTPQLPLPTEGRPGWVDRRGRLHTGTALRNRGMFGYTGVWQHIARANNEISQLHTTGIHAQVNTLDNSQVQTPHGTRYVTTHTGQHLTSGLQCACVQVRRRRTHPEHTGVVMISDIQCTPIHCNCSIHLRSTRSSYTVVLEAS